MSRKTRALPKIDSSIDLHSRDILSGGQALRQQAEAKRSKGRKKTGPLPATDADARRLVHELEVHQIELEMQNEELIQSRAKMESLLHQYTDLYDFAPVGYFTLTRDGTIKQANLTGAALLDVERGKLIKRRFGLFVFAKSRPVFNAFLEKIFTGEGKETCEIELLSGKTKLLWASIEAVSDISHTTCRVAVSDVTERKHVENELLIAKEALEEANMKLQIALNREQQLARTDVLTGVNNRRYLFELAGREFEIAIRYQRPLSIIIFDIDHFKKINDGYGHAVGDQMLQRITQIASAELRTADVIGRYGGEEFMIVLPMTTALQAYPLAERIRMEVDAARISTPKGDASVTLSIGIAEMNHTTGQSLEDVLNRADKAMYAAKHAGRDRTEIWEE